MGTFCLEQTTSGQGYNTMISTTGRCLCGSVRYAFTGDILWKVHCHCESCRRQTSSPVTTFFCVHRENLEFTGDEPAAYHSSKGVTRSFCGKCGSPMAFEKQSRPGEIDLYASTLDDHSDFTAEYHVFWNERVKWLETCDDLPKKEG